MFADAMGRGTHSYEEFLIELRGEPGGRYSVRVVRSPDGESKAEDLLVPLTPEEIDRFGEAMGRAARDVRHAALDVLGEDALVEVGERLFNSLFTGSVKIRYDRSLGKVLAPGGGGLRVRIEMGLGDPAMAPLHSIPWEYLCSPDDGQFLGLSLNLSLVRYLNLGLPGERPPVAPPLSILALTGDDPEESDLALLQELREMERAWGEDGAVRIKVLTKSSLEELRDELLKREHHVVHFMGHGGFDPDAGQGSLAFCDGEGRRVWVGGTDLAAHLRDRISLRLVFLNACWTARAASSAPYAGVATALAGAGVPAVLAMQFAVSDSAALAFSRSFYRRLAQGDTIDAAVTEGRMAILRLKRPIAEWGTPVLFERLASGRIVGSASRPARPRVPPRLAGAAALVLVTGLLAIWWLRSPPANGGGAAVSGQPLPGAAAQHAPAPPADSTGESTTSRNRPEAPVKRSHGAAARDTSAPRSYTLADRAAIYVEEVSTTISAEFSNIRGEPFLTLHLTPKGSPIFHQAVFGPTMVDLGQGHGRLHVQVIDWDAHTLQLTAQPAPH